jgi:serine/threonine protein kinase
VGCIFGEMMVCKPLFFGKKEEIEHLAYIFSVVGAPTEDSWPGVKDTQLWSKLSASGLFKPRSKPNWEQFEAVQRLTRSGFDVLNGLLACNPANRMSCADAMNHAWMTEAPVRINARDLPKWADSNSETHNVRRRIKSDDKFKPGGDMSSMGVSVNAKQYLAALEGTTQGDAPRPSSKNDGDDAPRGGPGPLPPGWLERKSGSTGKVYYINVKTKGTQWDRPTKPAT